MRFRQNVSLRCRYFFVCMLAGLGVSSCAHPEGHKDLLAFLQDGTTTKNEVETRIGPASVWGDGHIWTYRIGERPRASIYLRIKVAGRTHATAWCWSSIPMLSCVATR